MSSLFSKALVYLGLVDEDQPGGSEYDYDPPSSQHDDGRSLRQVGTAPEGRRVEPPAETARTSSFGSEPRIVHRVEHNQERERTSLRSNVGSSSGTGSYGTGSYGTGSYGTGSMVRPIDPRVQASVLVIEEFGDAKILADWTRDGVPVVMDLRRADSDLTRRVVDFSSGLIYALEGKMRKVGSGLVLVSPAGVELSDDERSRLVGLGAYEDTD